MMSKLLVIAASAFAFALSLHAGPFQVGSAVTDFQVADVNGASHAFSTLKGDTTVVIFISTQCPVSNSYNQRMEALYKDYSAKGVKFVFVNANYNETSKDVIDHAKQVGFTFPVYRDGSNVAELFNATVTPETYVIDKNGVLVYHGYIDDSMNEARIKKQGLRNALEEVLAGKAVTVSQTKAFGCAVKRRVGQGGNLRPIGNRPTLE